MLFKVLNKLDSYLKVSVFHKDFFNRNVQGIGYSYCLGGIAFTFFIFLIVSGCLLSLQYIPSERDAFASIVRIENEVFLGSIIRSIHKWSASFYIISIIAHSIRVFVSRAYQRPRELNWIVGVMTFVLAMASGFTGYLLPWDQKAYWATQVGTNMLSSVPLFGDILLKTVRGGEDINYMTLIRFYSLHVLYLPLLTAGLLWMHFHMVKRLGVYKKL